MVSGRQSCPRKAGKVTYLFLSAHSPDSFDPRIRPRSRDQYNRLMAAAAVFLHILLIFEKGTTSGK
jgi:hypothetical protein